jgi:hypothetical protein
VETQLETQLTSRHADRQTRGTITATVSQGMRGSVPKRDKSPRRFLKMMAGMFAALVDVTRLAIHHCLMKSGEQTVSLISPRTSLVSSTGAYQSRFPP